MGEGITNWKDKHKHVVRIHGVHEHVLSIDMNMRLAAQSTCTGLEHWM